MSCHGNQFLYSCRCVVCRTIGLPSLNGTCCKLTEIALHVLDVTVPLETISAFACGNTSSLPIVFTAKSPRLDKNRNRGKDEINRMPRPT